MTRPAISFSSSESASDVEGVRSLKTKNHTARKQTNPILPVSGSDGGAVVPILRDNSAVEVSERELDAHILDLARLVKKAQDDSDPHGAKLWTKDLADAINSRSAAHQRRLNDEAWERMLDADPCYFSAKGEHDRERA